MTTRSKIWMSKSKLKGAGVTVSEFLTKHRHDLFMRARQEFGISKCWTRDGTIFVLSAEGIRHSISSVEDIDEIKSNTVAMPAPITKEQSKTRRGAGKKLA